MSIYIDGRDCCQTGQFSQDVADGALTLKAVKPDSCVVREAQDWLRDRKLVDITDILR
ncbi:TPA: hypothetical protein PJF87_005126 [Escherichia coli]|nr:hypothetical protein [Escherichia coli]